MTEINILLEMARTLGEMDGYLKAIKERREK